jgi:hypothetical protein
MHKFIIVAMLSFAFYPEWPAHALAKGQEMFSSAKISFNVSTLVATE